MTYDPVDTNNDGIVDADVDNLSVNTDEMFTESIGAGDYHYAGDFAGTSETDRLSNAIQKADAGDRVYLESKGYNQDITIEKRLALVAPADAASDGPFISGTWTLNALVTIDNVGVGNTGNLVFKSGGVMRGGNVSGTITVDSDFVRLLGVGPGDGSITFQSGTFDGIVDGATKVTVTDNGSNVVGDIA